jgi:hypothetical protein
MESPRLLGIGDHLNKIGIQAETSQRRLDTLEPRLKSLEKRTVPLVPASWMFIFLLVIAVCFTGFLLYKGRAERPTVAIDYNVGEIIGGILAGGGAAAAGAAYYFKSKREERQ